MVNQAQFAADFPEFAPAALAQWGFASAFANAVLDPSVWGPSAPAGQPLSQYDLAYELVVAHNLALAALSAQSAKGGVPGLSKGIATSKSAGPISTSLDANVGSAKDGGHWNLTTYGVRFIEWAVLVGNVPMAVGPQVNLGAVYGYGASVALPQNWYIWG